MHMAAATVKVNANWIVISSKWCFALLLMILRGTMFISVFYSYISCMNKYGAIDSIEVAYIISCYIDDEYFATDKSRDQSKGLACA